MSAALAVTAAVALLAIVALVLGWRRATIRIDSERARAAALESQLRAAREATALAGDSDDVDEEDEEEASRPSDGEVADIVAHPVPAGPDEPSEAHAADGLVAAGPLWELERLRLEREWADIAGPSTPLPVPWDGSVRSMVAVEFDIIREVIGTPSRVEPEATATVAEPAAAVAAARLATEVLRRLAKTGEEMSVSFESDTDVTVALATEGTVIKPDLSSLTAVAKGFGGQLTLTETADGFQAELRLPAPPPDPSIPS